MITEFDKEIRLGRLVTQTVKPSNRMQNEHYAVIAETEDGQVFESPRVVRWDELTAIRQRADRATAGNWSVVVLHQFTLSHYVERCPDCKRPTADGHYNTKHGVCPAYEQYVADYGVTQEVA